MAELQVERADLYALREYMREHYQPSQEGFYLPGQREAVTNIFGRNNFTVTHVNENRGTYDFLVRRVGFFTMYDVLSFNYKAGAITAQIEELKDEFDKSLVMDVHAALSRNYSQLVSNLEDLLLKD